MMKKSKLLIAGICIALSFLAYTPAKAGTTTQTQQSSGLFDGLGDWLNGLFGGGSGSGSGSGSSGSGSTSGTSGGTSLPINGQAWLLIIAGGFVGCKVIMNKNKALATQKISS